MLEEEIEYLRKELLDIRFKIAKIKANKRLETKEQLDKAYKELEILLERERYTLNRLKKAKFKLTEENYYQNGRVIK